MLRRLFGRNVLTPQQRVEIVRKSITQYLNASAAPAERESAQANLHSNLVEIQRALYGDPESKTEEANDEVRQGLAEKLITGDLMLVLVRSLPQLEFEDRKIVSAIFKHLVHNNVKEFGSDFIAKKNITIVDELVDFYGIPSIALLAGSMFRECLRLEPVVCYLLKDGKSRKKMFETFVHSPKFEVSSDVLTTLRDLFTAHKGVVVQYLNENYDEFFTAYKDLLSSENYVTRRQSLKLLGELLLDRTNRQVMMRYIADRQNLRTIMMLLSDSQPNIQFEAFHVFKVFVANPQKSDAVKKLLINNKQRLINYLQRFHNDRAGDDQFVDEKALLLAELKQLPDKAVAPAPATAEGGATDTSAVGAGDAEPSESPEPSESAAATGAGGAGAGASAAAPTPAAAPAAAPPQTNDTTVEAAAAPAATS